MTKPKILSRWQFEPKDYRAVEYAEVTEVQKRKVDDILSRIVDDGEMTPEPSRYGVVSAVPDYNHAGRRIIRAVPIPEVADSSIGECVIFGGKGEVPRLEVTARVDKVKSPKRVKVAKTKAGYTELCSLQKSRSLTRFRMAKARMGYKTGIRPDGTRPDGAFIQMTKPSIRNRSRKGRREQEIG